MPLGWHHRHHQRGQPAGQLHRKHDLSVVCPGVRPDRRHAMEARHLWPRRFELVLLQQMGRALRPRSRQGAAENGAAGVRPTSRRRALRRPPLLASVKRGGSKTLPVVSAVSTSLPASPVNPASVVYIDNKDDENIVLDIDNYPIVSDPVAP